MPPPKTKRNLWLAFLDEAKANRLYIAYAQKAREEGHSEIAKLFEEIAEAETAHALSHLRALKEIKSTYENLKEVVEIEAQEAQQVFPRLLKEVRKEGDPEAIQSLEIAMHEGTVHLQKFSQALEDLKKKLKVSPSSTPQPTPVTPSPPLPLVNSEVGQEKFRIASLERIREIVFGLQDGIVSTVAVSSSMMLATGQTFPTLLAGLASALAGTISMSSGTYLASKSEKELHQAELDKEKQEVLQKPEEEAAELVEMYRQEGFSY
ncbi:MAG: VIT1/CCC1 transporter family protein, partial [Elusimicrobia bacterium]|nr:VIT1/CCC1 transporter family protein [Elusimicrobiota bacterium]